MWPAAGPARVRGHLPADHGAADLRGPGRRRDLSALHCRPGRGGARGEPSPRAADRRPRRAGDDQRRGAGALQHAAAHLLARSRIGGRPYYHFALVNTAPIDANSWTYYYSTVAAPDGVFQRHFTLMLSVWRSWSLNQQMLRAR